MDSGTFSPFINPDIPTPFFSAEFLKKCALLALLIMAEKEEMAINGQPKKSKMGK